MGSVDKYSSFLKSESLVYNKLISEAFAVPWLGTDKVEINPPP